MGLDMFLIGEKMNWGEPDFEDGFKVTAKQLELGYWRKHPNLHGFIVNTFADGVDECQKINLTVEDLKTILTAVKNNALPHTEGFFFGSSRESDKELSIEILEQAIAWAEDRSDGNVYKSVSYQASW